MPWATVTKAKGDGIKWRSTPGRGDLFVLLCVGVPWTQLERKLKVSQRFLPNGRVAS